MDPKDEQDCKDTHVYTFTYIYTSTSAGLPPYPPPRRKK